MATGRAISSIRAFAKSSLTRQTGVRLRSPPHHMPGEPKPHRVGDLLFCYHRCHQHHHLLPAPGPSPPCMPLQGCLFPQEQPLNTRTPTSIDVCTRRGDRGALLPSWRLQLGKRMLRTPPATRTRRDPARTPAGTTVAGRCFVSPMGLGQGHPTDPRPPPRVGNRHSRRRERWRAGGGRGAGHRMMLSTSRVPPGAAPAPRAGTHWYRLLPCCRFWPSLARLGLGSLAMSRSEGRERRGMSAGKKRGCQRPTPGRHVSGTGFPATLLS